MFKYAMKAAAKSTAQLANRIMSFKKIQVKPTIELYLSGSEDVFRQDNHFLVKNCLNFPECDYMVHFPIFDLKTKYIYDAQNNESEKVGKLLEFCKKINSNILIMHRCFGFNKEVDKAQAEEKFFEEVVRWNQMATGSDVKILIENYGFVWLPEGFDTEYVTSPLDHFFPWDIFDFHKKIKELNLHNIGIVLDIAHAVLSSNMFNMAQRYSDIKNDKRFQNIYDTDLQKTNLLRAQDFIYDFIDYFHVSDSFIWDYREGTTNMKKYLYVENLPLGHGNINYPDIFKNISGNKVIVMEINSENDDHVQNISQLMAVEFFQNNF